MQKMIKVLLVGILALTLTACQSEELDAASIYETARDNMQALDSYTMETAMVMTISSQSDSGSDLQITMPIDMINILVGINSDSPSQYGLMTADILGTTSTIEQWYIDGVYYIDEDGDRYSQTADDVEFVSNDLFSIAEMDDITATRDGGGYTLEIVMDGASVLELMMSTVADTSTSDLFDGTDINDSVTLTMQIDGDHYITATSVAMTLEMTDVGTLDITADFSYYDFNSSTLPDIDTSSFTEYSYTYSSGDIYGDYDLTTDYAEDLIALGYEDLGYDMYYNGVYTIDLEYKQIYTDYAIYDWEYDMGGIFDDDYSSVSCYYDFTYDYSDTDDCDLTTLQSLRDAYNELASSILEG